ncbi:bifunctional lysylphosphatidylglycerol flippase/synthetase MprF [Sphingomonas floccifaciens]|uniref:Bifunctional lysylphosphatidylglycerol flippase/synthetase MprF n=1 Tax=Sphingomonas floccifaciens TaxID=1844115 RepID=A0ABW4N7W2_9SPHN
MRKLVGIIALAIATPAAAGAAAAPSPDGLWLNPHHSVAVETAACGDRLCGRIVWANGEAESDAREAGVTNLVGTTLMQDYRPDGTGRWEGTVFVPDMHHSFASIIDQVTPVSLRVRGCILGGLVCSRRRGRGSRRCPVAERWQGRIASLRRIAERYRGWILGGVAVLLLAVALAALDRLTHEVRLADVKAAVAALPPERIALAVGFTALSYLALTFYDVIALTIIGRPLPWRTAATASFTSYTLSHNLGLALLTGGSARYRVYTAAGLDGPDVARIVGLAGATFWIGVFAVTGVALATHEGALVVPGLALGEGMTHALGVVIVVAIAAAFVATLIHRKPIRLLGMTIPLPGPRQFLAQLAIAAADLSCASAALFVLMPSAAPALLPAFVLAYALGIVASVVTHVPGGIGVFEAVVVAVLPGDKAVLLAALVVYRVVYYLAPLVLGILLLALHEGRRQRHAARFLTGIEAAVESVAPTMLAAAAFGGGALLLLSGALPAEHGRLRDLAHVLPLPFIEASHLAASVVGTLLLLLAPGLYRRLDGANLAARILLVAGAVFSLAKGFDYEEAIVCLVIAGLLQWTRAAFYRRTALTQIPVSGGWLVSIATVFAAAMWAGFFAFRHVPYSDDLWWRVALRGGDAPRFLRASLISGILLGAAVTWRLLAPARALPEAAAPDPERLAQALDHAERSDAMLALTGDKRFFWSDDGRAFAMYAVAGDSWAVMGDPVGPQDAWPELLWQLREAAHRVQARLLLYEVSGAVLDLAIGMGLEIVKFGEEAVIDLAEFDLETPRLRSVRKATRALDRKGLSFRIVPAAAQGCIIDELQAVSDAWLAAKGQREKRFSLGRFDRDYLSRFDIAVAMLDGRVVAFANIWATANRGEASFDLMRHSDDAPSGTMDFLFVHLALWAKARGYRRFSLGMAPLSGIADRRLAPAWARLAAFAFRHGERLYGFRGLRAYKDKFAPRWEPRYVAGPSGIGLLLALRDVTRLIGDRNPASAATSVPPIASTRVAYGLALVPAAA